MAKIGSVERGKIGELYVFSELLRRGATVFSPIADIRGIDAVVRKKDGTFLAVQVKTHSTEYMAEWFDVHDLHDHDLDTFVVVGINMGQYPPSDVWIVPARVFIEYGTLFDEVWLRDKDVVAVKPRRELDPFFRINYEGSEARAIEGRLLKRVELHREHGNSVLVAA